MLLPERASRRSSAGNGRADVPRPDARALGGALHDGRTPAARGLPQPPTSWRQHCSRSAAASGIARVSPPLAAAFAPERGSVQSREALALAPQNSVARRLESPIGAAPSAVLRCTRVCDMLMRLWRATPYAGPTRFEIVLATHSSAAARCEWRFRRHGGFFGAARFVHRSCDRQLRHAERSDRVRPPPARWPRSLRCRPFVR